MTPLPKVTKKYLSSSVDVGLRSVESDVAGQLVAGSLKPLDLSFLRLKRG